MASTEFTLPAISGHLMLELEWLLKAESGLQCQTGAAQDEARWSGFRGRLRFDLQRSYDKRASGQFMTIPFEPRYSKLMTDIPSHPLSHSYAVVDVFNDTAFKGNAVAVVFDADHLSDAEMLSFTRWTNLSEAVFVLTATDPLADYRLRIFSSLHELDFAGHPTLGACHAWLEKTGHQELRDYVQQCGVGLVTLRRSGEGLAFRAPPLIRSGAIDAPLLERVSSGLRLQAVGAHLVTAQWVDNGAGWLAVMIDDRDKLLALKPDFAQLDGLAIGVLAPWRSPPCDGEVDFELRAFIAGDSLPEDPATGSLAAGIAQWFAQTGQPPSSYTFSQGTALDRPCRIRVSTMADGIWIGGATKTLIRGQVQFPGSVATRG